jgi:hypothetical protein
MMKKCLDSVCAMATYDPSTLKGIQLVDARLALAKVTEEKTALFVIKTFGDDIEKAEIVQQKAEASLDKDQRCVDDEEARIASLQAAHRHFTVPTYPMYPMPTSHQNLWQTGLFNITPFREALPQVTPMSMQIT